jgi:hypothetical protein
MHLPPVLLRLQRFSQQFEFHFLQQLLVRLEFPFCFHMFPCGAGIIFNSCRISTPAFAINDSLRSNGSRQHHLFLLHSGFLLRHRSARLRVDHSLVWCPTTPTKGSHMLKRRMPGAMKILNEEGRNAGMVWLCG